MRQGHTPTSAVNTVGVEREGTGTMVPTTAELELAEAMYALNRAIDRLLDRDHTSLAQEAMVVRNSVWEMRQKLDENLIL